MSKIQKKYGCLFHVVNRTVKSIYLVNLSNIVSVEDHSTLAVFMFSFYLLHIKNFLLLSSKFHLRRPMAFLSLSLYAAPGLFLI